MNQLDVSDTIIAKSDQLNAVDLPPAEIIVKIIDVKRVNDKDQPVHLHLKGHEGRPYKPCLSMRRILIHAWGQYADNWIGQSMSLYCDNSVTWAGKEVGGIRIKELSGITEPVQTPIALNQRHRELYTVNPLVIDWVGIAKKHITAINNCLTESGLNECKKAISKDRPGMPEAEFNKIIAAGEAKKAGLAQPNPEPV
jgi:hypothetical protein